MNRTPDNIETPNKTKTKTNTPNRKLTNQAFNNFLRKLTVAYKLYAF